MVTDQTVKTAQVFHLREIAVYNIYDKSVEAQISLHGIAACTYVVIIKVV